MKALHTDPCCPVNSCITLGKLFSLTELSFFTCQMGIDHNTHFMKFLKDLNKIKHVNNSNR